MKEDYKKRIQVPVACGACRKACKKCDEIRPCARCVKYGIEADCSDSPRRERKKGFKRGPYKSSNFHTHFDPESPHFDFINVREEKLAMKKDQESKKLDVLSALCSAVLDSESPEFGTLNVTPCYSPNICSLNQINQLTNQKGSEHSDNSNILPTHLNQATFDGPQFNYQSTFPIKDARYGIHPISPPVSKSEGRNNRSLIDPKELACKLNLLQNESSSLERESESIK